ncbi:MAG: SurA N-terminal domain-containing protein, partial [Legionellaceae bacterium]|nr:SurA N-terminal domain-containing protein [Legionellaceae bacterium]
MLQKLNERLQGVIAWVVVSIVALTFTLFGVDYYFQSRQQSDALATVNHTEISKTDFERQYRLAQQHEPLTATAEKHLKSRVVDEMILQTASVQSAQKAGFFIGTPQVNQTIVHIPQFQEDGQFSEVRYQQALSNQWYSDRSFQNDVQQGMLLNQLHFAFVGTTFVVPQELEYLATLAFQTRDYDFTVIKPSFF